jgi:hypothetical protein
MPWAEFDAVTTSLASIFQDIHNTRGNLNFFRIERNPPEFHGPSLISVLN